MAISYLLAPQPEWIMIDDLGDLAGASKLYTYSNLNKTVAKYFYQDSAGSAAWPSPINFDLNGTKGPFYAAFDENNTDDTYYLEAFDSSGNLLWTRENYMPNGGSGGGGGGTVYSNLKNYINNNVFFEHNYDSASPINSTIYYIAPGNHAGMCPRTTNLVQADSGDIGAGLIIPDIYFIKNNTTATDKISFVTIDPITTPFTGSVAPLTAVNYTCSSSGTSETRKGFQYFITQGVKHLANQEVTVSFWAIDNSGGGAKIEIHILQYFGSKGSPSATNFKKESEVTLTSSWAQYTVSFTIDTTSGKTLGSCGDDSLYISLQLPKGTTCNISHTLLSMYLGNISPPKEYSTYDQLAALSFTPRTGTVKQAMGQDIDSPGWLTMDDVSTLGKAAGSYQGTGVFPLYKFMWDGIDNAFAIVSSGRGSNAEDDFEANKTITIPSVNGRVMGSAGSGAGLTVRHVGEDNVGEETHTLIEAEVPTHTHNYGEAFAQSGSSGAPGLVNIIASGSQNSSSFGGGGAHNNMQPTVFMKWYIKL